MKFELKHQGKWVAIKKEQVVESDKTLTKLTQKTKSRKDQKQLYYTLVPNGFIAG